MENPSRFVLFNNLRTKVERQIPLTHGSSYLEKDTFLITLCRAMEQSSSPNSNRGKSCWGCIRLKLPWITERGRRGFKRQQGSQSSLLGCSHDIDIMSSLTSKPQVRPPGFGGFRYDPISYSQNFDEGLGDEEVVHRGFTSRYAMPPSQSPRIHSEVETINKLQKAG